MAKSSRSALKWKVIVIFSVLIVLVAFAVMSWVRISFEEYVRSAEIARFRSSVIAALRIESKNYYTSLDARGFEAAVSEVRKINPELDMVFLSDVDGNIVGDDSGVYGKIEGALAKRMEEGWDTSVDFDTEIKASNGREVVVTYKGELDPYAIHFGFSNGVIKGRTQELSRKIVFVVGLTAGVTILLGAAFMHISIRPIEKLARDAEKLSHGDMNVHLKRGSRTEVGRIYSSLSRLRESILYSLKRLDVR